MRHSFGKTIVIALGGSVIFPENLDVKLLKDFRSFIKKWAYRKKFVIVVGGGRLCRMYQEAAASVARITDEEKDWLGIQATRANAHLLKTILGSIADPDVIDSEKKVKKLSTRGARLPASPELQRGEPDGQGSASGGKYPVTIASGWRPGWSTDYVAFVLARDFKVREVVVAGKPKYVYDKDFDKHKSAKPFSKISWAEYRKLIPAKWKPGAHLPVDSVAARLASRKNITGIVVNGKDLKNLDNLLKGKEFLGTIIE